MKFEVITQSTGEKETFKTMEEVNDHIQREITWMNSPSENEKNNGYTEDDFTVREINE